MEIKEKTFVVSGGSSGLGRACVELFAEEGAKVLIVDLNEEQGKELEQKNENISFVKVDVTNEQDVQNLTQKAKSEFGGIHGVINCAGIGAASRVLAKEGPHSLSIFEKIISVNLIGTFNLIRLCAHTMSLQEANAGDERGVIINTASVAAFDGQIGQAAYSASKGGVVGMTLPIAREFAKFGIRVVTIAPGIFDTPMLAGLPEKARESLGKQVPFPSRLGQPKEYAKLCKHIVENQMLNGEVIRLDGAIRMAPK